MICANPDIVVQRGDKLIYCGGALAQLYAQLGGEVFMAGKPHAPIYDLCLTEAERLLNRPVDRRRVLCIGDGLATDIKGANDQAWTSYSSPAVFTGLRPSALTALICRRSTPC